MKSSSISSIAGKVRALDFQGYGSGLVTVELMYFFRLSPLNNYDDIVEITKGSLFFTSLVSAMRENLNVTYFPRIS